MAHVLLPTYDFIMPFKDERRQTNIIHNGLFGIIDIEGKTIIQPEHVFIEQSSFAEESFIIKNEAGYWGIIDTNNETIIPAEYSAITAYDAELDYFWGIPKNSTAWNILNKDQQVKNPLYFDFPVLLSHTPYTAVRVYIEEDDAFKSGVIKCTTLEPLVPYKYEKIQQINDSIFMCYKNTSTDSPFGCDLYIHNHRIDSVNAITFLPNNILAINKNNHWGYFSGDDWIIIPADGKPTKNIEDHVKILNLTFSNEDESYLEGSGSVSLFMNTVTTSPIRILTNNKALQVYCNTLAEESFDEEDFSAYPSITVFDDTYISDLMEEKETVEDEEFYNWRGYNNSGFYATTDIKSTVLTENLSEVRYFYNREDRYGNYITRIDTTYTVKNNVLVPVSLGDITNHIKSNSMLSTLLLVQLDSLRDIQLPCTDRENIVELADAWQLEKDGIHFFYTDERDENSYDYEEIEVVLLYAELIKQFKNSPYLKELYANSLKQ
jgi:hypothetical protein